MNRRHVLLLPFLMASTAHAAERADLVIMEKGKRVLRLLRHGRDLRAYRVSLGFDPVGHKQRSGDGRTPEGLYRIGGELHRSNFYRALRISYPNPWDRKRAATVGERPGGQIMIHGLPGGKTSLEMGQGQFDWTNGCIALTNREMDEVARLVPAGTPILIRP